MYGLLATQTNISEVFECVLVWFFLFYFYITVLLLCVYVLVLVWFSVLVGFFFPSQ